MLHPSLGQHSPTHFKQFGYVLQNAKQRERYTGHSTHLKDVAQTVAEHYITTASDSC